MGRHKDATRQYDVLEKIVEFKRANGISPTIRDLMASTGVTSTSVMHYYLNLLEEEGLISRIAGASRSILVKSERNYLFYYRMRRRIQRALA